jgi:hypothetical protein
MEGKHGHGKGSSDIKFPRIGRQPLEQTKNGSIAHQKIDLSQKYSDPWRKVPSYPQKGYHNSKLSLPQGLSISLSGKISCIFPIWLQKRTLKRGENFQKNLQNHYQPLIVLKDKIPVLRGI